jgi:hypothetical protein
MAIFHMSVKSGSRARQQSAAAHGAYIAREGRYATRAAAEACVAVTHANMPEWAQDAPLQFWKAADENERANGRLWTELEFSLPRELAREQQIALAQEFAAETCGDRHAYTLAVHVPQTLDGQAENPHAHLMLSERVIDERTRSLGAAEFFKRNGAKKDRRWNEAAKVEELRQVWEARANAALERGGAEPRVDRRSLDEQRAEALRVGDVEKAEALNRAPEPKLGLEAVAVRRAHQLAAAGREAEASQQLGPRARQVLQIRRLKGVVASLGERIRAAGRELAEVLRLQRSPATPAEAYARTLSAEQREQAARFAAEALRSGELFTNTANALGKQLGGSAAAKQYALHVVVQAKRALQSEQGRDDPKRPASTWRQESGKSRTAPAQKGHDDREDDGWER